MSALLTPAEAATYLRVRDRRTLVKRLRDLGVPTVPAGRSFLVRTTDLERALAAHARPLTSGPPARPAGVVLSAGERLWDTGS